MQRAKDRPSVASELALFAADPVVVAFLNYHKGRHVYDWRGQRCSNGVLVYGAIVTVDGVRQNNVAWCITGKEGWCAIATEWLGPDLILLGNVEVEYAIGDTKGIRSGADADDAS